MVFIDREYVPGDKITVKTQISQGANIAGVEAVYEGPGNQVIVLSKGTTDDSPDVGTPTLHPGPYLEGSVTIEGTIAAEQRPGIYALKSVDWITANKQRLNAHIVPESFIRVTEGPQVAGVNGWELGGGERVGEFEEGTAPS